MRLIRLLLSGGLLAFPVTCSNGGSADGVYTGGIQPSIAANINPSAPNFYNGGGGGSR